MHSHRFTPIAAALISSGLLGWASGVHAQAAAAPAAAASAPAPAASEPAHAAPRTEVTEVVVTAQKIEQPASKTPVALSVVGGEDLKSGGVVDIRALDSLAPGVQIGQESGKAQVAIRGVMSQDMTEKGDPSAAFNVDGAYIARPEAQLGAFFDLDRVEVLRGPQGTLYGRNATAGAINLITNRPGNKFEALIGAEVGDYGTIRTDGMINVPLGANFALRAALNTNKHDSYIEPGPNAALGVPMESQDDQAGRVELLGKFGTDTSLLLTAETHHTGGHTPTPVPISNFFDGEWTGTLPFSPANRGNNLLDPVYVDRGTTAQRTAAWEFHQGSDSHQDNRSDSLRAEFSTGVGDFAQFTYLLAHDTGKIDQELNGVYFGFPLDNPETGSSHSTSNELRLNSVGKGPWRWVAGLYAFDESIDRVTSYNTYISAPFGDFVVNVPYQPHVENQSRAAFGQLTYSVTNDFRLTGGLRRTNDEKSGTDPYGGTTDGSGAFSADVKFSNWSWKLGFEQDLGKTTMLYGGVSTGYKAGGFNDQKGASFYKPEQLMDIEVGVKGRYLDNALVLSLSAFHYDYTDLQVTSVVCTSQDLSSCGSLTTNAASAGVDGIEAEGKWAVVPGGEIRFGLAYNNARYKSYQPTQTVDFSGERLDHAPLETVSLGYNHDFEFESGAMVSAFVGTYWSSSYFISDPAAGVRYEQPNFHKSDASLGWTSSNARYTVQAFIKNIENTTTIESHVPGSFFIGDPRTYGVRMSAKF
jgi:iron complex outermembrane receptor protein